MFSYPAFNSSTPATLLVETSPTGGVATVQLSAITVCDPTVAQQMAADLGGVIVERLGQGTPATDLAAVTSNPGKSYVTAPAQVGGIYVNFPTDTRKVLMLVVPSQNYVEFAGFLWEQAGGKGQGTWVPEGATLAFQPVPPPPPVVPQPPLVSWPPPPPSLSALQKLQLLNAQQLAEVFQVAMALGFITG